MSETKALSVICMLKGGALFSMELFSGSYYSEVEALHAKVAEVQVLVVFLN